MRGLLGIKGVPLKGIGDTAPSSLALFQTLGKEFAPPCAPPMMCYTGPKLWGQLVIGQNVRNCEAK